MSTFKIDGFLSLAEVARAIRDIEITRNRFVGCTVRGRSNEVAFVQENVPRPFELLQAGKSPSWPAELVWKGTVRSSDANETAYFFRKHDGVKTPASDVASTKGMEDAESMLATSGAVPGLAPLISRGDFVKRALSAVDTNTAYLSPGVTPSLQAERWPEDGAKIDCSGFIAWCFRMARRTGHPLYRKFNDGWLDTSALHHDGLQPTGFFNAVGRGAPGSLVVFPDANGKQGHVGIVLAADGDGVAAIREVVHCSLGNFNDNGRAIRKTDARVWERRSDSIIIDYEGFTD